MSTGGLAALLVLRFSASLVSVSLAFRDEEAEPDGSQAAGSTHASPQDSFGFGLAPEAAESSRPGAADGSQEQSLAQLEKQRPQEERDGERTGQKTTQDRSRKWSWTGPGLAAGAAATRGGGGAAQAEADKEEPLTREQITAEIEARVLAEKQEREEKERQEALQPEPLAAEQAEQAVADARAATERLEHEEMRAEAEAEQLERQRIQEEAEDEEEEEDWQQMRQRKKAESEAVALAGKQAREEQERRQAAVKLQSIYRGRKARKQMPQIQKDLATEKAARDPQNWQREYLQDLKAEIPDVKDLWCTARDEEKRRKVEKVYDKYSDNMKKVLRLANVEDARKMTIQRGVMQLHKAIDDVLARSTPLTRSKALSEIQAASRERLDTQCDKDQGWDSEEVESREGPVQHDVRSETPVNATLQESHTVNDRVMHFPNGTRDIKLQDITLDRGTSGTPEDFKNNLLGLDAELGAHQVGTIPDAIMTFQTNGLRAEKAMDYWYDQAKWVRERGENVWLDALLNTLKRIETDERKTAKAIGNDYRSAVRHEPDAPRVARSYQQTGLVGDPERWKNITWNVEDPERYQHTGDVED
mmetsp:Transcript_65440/g.113884  ORF Transcript_65440/g.113884 Transcript_65440/m.113884 type:complete len:588 (+) Transcript_65440:79-1842(+)